MLGQDLALGDGTGECLPVFLGIYRGGGVGGSVRIGTSSSSPASAITRGTLSEGTTRRQPVGQGQLPNAAGITERRGREISDHYRGTGQQRQTQLLANLRRVFYVNLRRHGDHNWLGRAGWAYAVVHRQLTIPSSGAAVQMSRVTRASPKRRTGWLINRASSDFTSAHGSAHLMITGGHALISHAQVRL